MDRLRVADEIGIPRLSAAAEAPVGVVRAARDERVQVEACRFGEEGVRAML